MNRQVWQREIISRRKNLASGRENERERERHGRGQPARQLPVSQTQRKQGVGTYRKKKGKKPRGKM